MEKLKKIKMHAIGNADSFNYYIFDKKNYVIKRLAKLFHEVLKLGPSLNEDYEDKRGRWKSRVVNFEKKTDSHQVSNRIGRKSRIDIFYGNKKVFIMIYCSQKNRLKLNEKLSKIAFMPKPKRPKRSLRLN